MKKFAGTQRLGRGKFEPYERPVLLTEELVGSLRELKPQVLIFYFFFSCYRSYLFSLFITCSSFLRSEIIPFILSDEYYKKTMMNIYSPAI